MLLKDAIKHLEEELNNKQDWSCVACKEDHKQLLEWLKELQVIKNSKPSEALEYLEYIGETCYIEAGNAEEDCTLYAKNYIGYDTIKNYILKAQEQEKVSSILKEKRIDLEGFYTMFVEDNFDYNYYVNRYGTYGLKCLTEEEFNIVKEIVR